MPRSPQQSTTIDKWINKAKHHVVAPVGDALVPNRSLEYLLWEDDVECVLHVKQKALVGGLFEDCDEFTLTLRLRVPSSSGFLAYYIHSPVVVIDKFTGKEDDVHAPMWLQGHQLERKFWQPRSQMLDLILYFVADLPENARLCSKVETTQSKVPASGTTTSIRPLAVVKHASPYNTRSHKKRSSELSAKESQRLRKTRNYILPPSKQCWNPRQYTE